MVLFDEEIDSRGESSDFDDDAVEEVAVDEIIVVPSQEVVFAVDDEVDGLVGLIDEVRASVESVKPLHDYLVLHSHVRL